MIGRLPDVNPSWEICTNYTYSLTKELISVIGNDQMAIGLPPATSTVFIYFVVDKQLQFHNIQPQ
jgi:hypothetical protein